GAGDLLEQRGQDREDEADAHGIEQDGGEDDDERSGHGTVQVRGRARTDAAGSRSGLTVGQAVAGSGALAVAVPEARRRRLLDRLDGKSSTCSLAPLGADQGRRSLFATQTRYARGGGETSPRGAARRSSGEVREARSRTCSHASEGSSL